VAQASGRYVDVVSTNFDAHWNDGTAVHYFLSTLFELSQKPIMIGEFYLAAMENRSGNQNNSAYFPTVQTQAERATGFLTTLKYLAQTPFVIGADWFQFYDEPMYGRDDGENFNMGLIDIYGKPYAELISASRSFDANQRKIQSTVKKTDSGIPPAPEELVLDPTKNLVLKNWDREKGYMPALSPTPVADLYLCWNQDALYLAIYADDVIERQLYRDKKIPPEDRMKLTIAFKGGSVINIRLGGEQQAALVHPQAEIIYTTGIRHSVRHISIIQLPASLFGKKLLKRNDKMQFAVTLQTLARAYLVKWDIRTRLN